MPLKIGLIAAAMEGTIDFVALAQRAEALGFESLWSGEHTVVPAQAPSLERHGESTQDHMRRLGDPLIALAAAAGATRTLRIGTAVTLVPEHEPILMAKQVATLDFVSHGRFDLGIGAGWLREESEVLGVDFPRRWRQTREHVLAMKALWTQDQAAFSGEYVTFAPLWCWPKPIQKPHPPILIAGVLDKAPERIAEYGDGWMPLNSPTLGTVTAPAGIEAGRRRIAALYRERGRDPASLDVTLWGCKPDRAVMRSYAGAGVTRILFVFAGAPASDALERLEKLAGQVL